MNLQEKNFTAENRKKDKPPDSEFINVEDMKHGMYGLYVFVVSVF